MMHESGQDDRGADAADPVDDAPGTPSIDHIVRLFVEHWGGMARSWGINATMGELFALLYISGEDWTADDLKERLSISRGNVSMNLRELMAWGVVHKVHRQGERREYYRAESDVWTLFRRILAERKRRELDPTLSLLERTVTMVAGDPALERYRDRVVALTQFFAMIDGLSNRLIELESDEVRGLADLFTPPESGS